MNVGARCGEELNKTTSTPSTIEDGLRNNKPFWRYTKARNQDNIGVAPLKEKGHLYSASKNKARTTYDTNNRP